MSKPSQDDIIAENTRMKADLTAARGEVTRLKAENEKLVAERDSTATAPHGFTNEHDALKADQDKLAAEGRDFERRMSAELAPHGIRKEGVATPAGAGWGESLS